MFGAQNLKTHIDTTETTVECPVRGCQRVVDRQRRSFRREAQFLCPEHRIYTSPSTFEYENEADNLLWHGSEDIALLQAIKTVKRENRMARERSEDALTWNVFRYLERHGLVASYLAFLTRMSATSPQIVYWSYSAAAQRTWPCLAQARSEFGENPRRSSEPDLIVVSDQALFFIESKLTADNRTVPSRPIATKKYLTGGERWYERVFHSEYETVAVHEQRYELTRFWLLGSWMAAQLDLTFYLISLVKERQEQNLEDLVRPHLRADTRRQFLRRTWENVFDFVCTQAPSSQDRNQLLAYLQNKTIGYDSLGNLHLAFHVGVKSS